MWTKWTHKGIAMSVRMIDVDTRWTDFHKILYETFASGHRPKSCLSVSQIDNTNMDEQNC
jgi:hypothetical protein